MRRYVTALAALLLCVDASISGKNATISLLIHNHNPKTWFGSSAVALQGVNDPVFMTSTWVYPPDEILGFRPLNKSSWQLNTTRDMKYQTLEVRTASSSGAFPQNAVDSLVMWLRKPDGIDGICTLLGFNSQEPPTVGNVSVAAAAAEDTPLGAHWRLDLPVSCLTVNSWTPWVEFELSGMQQGNTAVAWALLPTGNVTIFSIEGQTGKLRWLQEFGVPSFDAQQYLSYGVSVCESGEYLVFDQGVEGLGDHGLYVINTTSGEIRDVVPSAVAMQGQLSADGTFLFSQGQTVKPEVTLHQWSEKDGQYIELGTAIAPISTGAQDEPSWFVTDGVFSEDVEGNRTLFAAIWIADGTLSGNGVFAVYDTADFASSSSSSSSITPVAYYVMNTVPGSDIAVDSAQIDCQGVICAAALMVQMQKNNTVPSVVVLNAKSGSSPNTNGVIFTYASPGSMNSVSVAYDGATYYVGAAGCDTYGVCIAPGADAYMWEVSGV